jgi:hypothetical protein
MAKVYASEAANAAVRARCRSWRLRVLARVRGRRLTATRVTTIYEGTSEISASSRRTCWRDDDRSRRDASSRGSARRTRGLRRRDQSPGDPPQLPGSSAPGEPSLQIPPRGTGAAEGRHRDGGPAGAPADSAQRPDLLERQEPLTALRGYRLRLEAPDRAVADCRAPGRPEELGDSFSTARPADRGVVEGDVPSGPAARGGGSVFAAGVRRGGESHPGDIQLLSLGRNQMSAVMTILCAFLRCAFF